MAGRDNLKAPRSTEEAREWGRKGGQKAARTYARRKQFRELFKSLMTMPFDKDPELTNQMAIAKAMILEAASGNTNAFKEIRDTLGEKPKDQVEAKEDIQVTYRVVRS